MLVVDDGSTDETQNVAQSTGVDCIRHPTNLGKGAAIRSGLAWALRNGFDQIVTADADGQHPAASILRLVEIEAPEGALVLGVRDLVRARAPKANQTSNCISNRFLSLFTGMALRDTQCGLRRYPVRQTLALRCRDSGYAFEAEVILRAVAHGMPVVQTPIVVRYPEGKDRVSHFHVFRDPLRIVTRVVTTLLE